MTDLRGNPKAMRDQASDWTRLADTTSAVATRLVRRSETVAFAGPAATRFRASLRHLAQQAAVVEHDLSRAAGRLSVAADALEAAQRKANRNPTPAPRRTNPPRSRLV